MDKLDTLPKPNTKPSLQELLTGVKPTPDSSTPPYHRRAEDRASSSGVVLEPVARKPYDLSYACLLIPRLNAHYLIGDIAESLHEWMHQVCVSFAWRLEDLRIRPEFMQWVLYVPAATPPSKCIRTIREHTSRKIMADFPHIRRENLSKDFWAPGYLVTMGPAPHSPEMINQFILLTRQQQGIQPRLGK